MRATSLISILFSLLLIGGGCVGDLETFEPVGGGGGGAGPDAGAAGGADAGINAAAKTYFDTNVAPLLSALRPKGSCVGCHEGQDPANGADFLGLTAADTYAALIGDTRLISTTAAASVFPNRGEHTGNGFCTGPGAPDPTCTADEVGIVGQWIALEAAQ